MENNFDIEIQTVQLYTCADGTQFNNVDDAKAHNELLKQKAADAQFQKDTQQKLDSYLNHAGLTGRNRVQKQTIIKAFLEWERNWDGKFIVGKVEEEKEEVTTPKKEIALDQEVVDVPAEANMFLADGADVNPSTTELDEIF